MIVSVISPHAHGNGNTLTSMFLALGLNDMKKKVLLTHTKPMSNSFYTYFGLQEYEDKTSTPTQLIKLMREEAIKPEEIGDFCKHIADSVDVFTTNQPNLSEDDMFEFAEHVVKIQNYDFIVYDINDISSKTSTLVIRESDVVIINLTQSFIELEEFKLQQQKLMKLCQGKKVILVVNKYSKIVGSIKEINSKLGTKAPLNVIHFNPYIQWGCNNGKLLEVYKRFKLKDSRFIELDKDMQNIASIVSKARIAVLKERQQQKKPGGVKK